MVADTENSPLKSLALVETTKKSTSTWQKHWKLSCIVLSTVSLMSSGISPMKIQWTSLLTKRSREIKTLPSHNSISCLSSLFTFINIGICSCSSRLPDFQVRCLSFIPPLIASSLSYSFSHSIFSIPVTAVLSLDLDVSVSYNASICPISPSNSKLTPLPLFDRYIHSNFIRSQSYSFLRRTRVLVYPEIIW